MASSLMPCPHLYALDCILSPEIVQYCREHGQCEACPTTTRQDKESLWLCLYKDCMTVLCGDNEINHVTEHHQRQPAHALLLNLHTLRVWCMICRMEVTMLVHRRLTLEDKVGEEEPECDEIEVGESASTTSMGPQPLPYTEADEDDEEEIDEEENDDDDPYLGSMCYDDKLRGLVGLNNLGNTCYMNAALQVLNCSPGFASYFLRCEGALATSARKPVLAPAYRELVREVWRRDPEDSLSPSNIFYVFRQLHPGFRMYLQQDSQEFLRYFLDELHDDLKQPLPVQNSESADEDEDRASVYSVKSSAKLEVIEDSRAVYSSSIASLPAVSSSGSFDEASASWPPFRSSASRQQTDGASCGSNTLPSTSESSGFSEMRETPESNRVANQLGAAGVEEGADSEEASYETCDSGVSADESENYVSQRSGIQHKRWRRLQRNRASSPHAADKRRCSPSPPAQPRVKQSPSTASASQRSTASSLSPHRVSSNVLHSTSSFPDISLDCAGRFCITASPKRALRHGAASSSSSVLPSDQQASPVCSTKETCTPASSCSLVSRKSRRPQQQFSGSIVSDLFDGQLISSVQCLTCCSVSTRRETFQDLSLPIPSGDGVSAGGAMQASAPSNESWMWWVWQWLMSWVWGPVVSLHHCLNAFFSADELKGDNMYSCEKCGKLRNGVKFSKVVKLPEVLVIHLKRFRHDYLYSSKISQHVTFPLTGLNLQPFLHHDCQSEVRQYSLYGVICHHGSVGGGHYTAMAQHPVSGHWYEFNDDCVMRVSPDTVQRCQAYVLFYKKVSSHAAKVRSLTSSMMQVAPRQPSLLRFYISKQWWNKFLTFSECGPIDNSDFLCPHGGVDPRKLAVVTSMIKVVREEVWLYLKEQFGGGPVCTSLYLCYPCKNALDALLHRQQKELSTFKLLNSVSARVYGVPMSWFKQWEEFVFDRTQVPPPAIDNTTIIKQHQMRKQIFRSARDYITITANCWQFFQSTYGGGPEFCLQQGCIGGLQREFAIQQSYCQQDAMQKSQDTVQESQRDVLNQFEADDSKNIEFEQADKFCANLEYSRAKACSGDEGVALMSESKDCRPDQDQYSVEYQDDNNIRDNGSVCVEIAGSTDADDEKNKKVVSVAHNLTMVTDHATRCMVTEPQSRAAIDAVLDEDETSALLLSASKSEELIENTAGKLLGHQPQTVSAESLQYFNDEEMDQSVDSSYEENSSNALFVHAGAAPRKAKKRKRRQVNRRRESPGFDQPGVHR